MPEIKRAYGMYMPAVKLVGIRYSENDATNGNFSAKWIEWFERDMFTPLRIEGEEPFEDANAYIGLSVCKADGRFDYWIGAFLPENAEVPAGYDSLALDAGDIEVFWVYGKEPDIYSFCCLERLKSEGFEWASGSDGSRYCFERYVCPRFTDVDADGCRILDMCYYVKRSN